MSDLLARMAQLRKKAKDENPCPYSEVRVTSPLSLFLVIYSKASHECYIDYMHGAKALLAWLTVGDMDLDYQEDKYPQINDTSFKVPVLLRGYASNELATFLEPYEKYTSSEEYFAAQARASRAIYLTMKDMT